MLVVDASMNLINQFTSPTNKFVMQINQYTLTLKQIGSLELDKKKDV